MELRAVIFACLLFVSGCKTTTTPTAVTPPSGTATVGEITALNGRIAELETQLTKERDLAQRAAGSVYGAGAANAYNAPGLPKQTTAAQIDEAATALPVATPEQRAIKDAQNAKALAGQLDAVLAEMKVTGDDNKRLRDELAAARANEAEALRVLAQAKADGERERAEAAAKLQRVLDAQNDRIKKAEDEAKNQVRMAQVDALNKWGAGLAGAGILALGLAGVFGGIAALRVAGPIALLAILSGMACFGMAQIVGQWWFMWAVLAAVVACAVIVAWWVIKKHKAGVLAEATKAKADKATGLLRSVIPVLDSAYDEADAAAKELLDKTVFSRLSSVMDKDQKAEVHQIRAEATKPNP